MIEIRGPFNVFHLNRAVMYEFILCPKSKNYLEDFEKNNWTSKKTEEAIPFYL